ARALGDGGGSAASSATKTPLHLGHWTLRPTALSGTRALVPQDGHSVVIGMAGGPATAAAARAAGCRGETGGAPRACGRGGGGGAGEKAPGGGANLAGRGGHTVGLFSVGGTHPAPDEPSTTREWADTLPRGMARPPRGGLMIFSRSTRESAKRDLER